MSADENGRRRSRRLVQIAALGLVAGLAILWPYWQEFGITRSADAQRWGLFGDYLGGVLGAVLAFASLLVLVETLLTQQDELKSTRKFLEGERVQLERLLVDQRQNLEKILSVQSALTSASIEHQKLQLTEIQNSQRWSMFQAGLADLDRIRLTPRLDQLSAWNMFRVSFAQFRPTPNEDNVHLAVKHAMQLAAETYPVIIDLRQWTAAFSVLLGMVPEPDAQSSLYFQALQRRVTPEIAQFLWAFALESKDQSRIGSTLKSRLVEVDVVAKHFGFKHLDRLDS